MTLTLIGKQPFHPQVWIRGVDLADLLTVVSGYMVGSYADLGTRGATDELLRDGFLRLRLHVAPAGVWSAYALTERGFELLARIGSGGQHDGAVRQHRWYAERGCMGPVTVGV